MRAKQGRLIITNIYENISPRLRQTLCCVWSLNDQERSYLDRHFMLIRTKRELRGAHVDNHQLGAQITNGGITYDVIMQGLEGWKDLGELDKICTSWRYNNTNRLAIVIVRPYTKEVGE